MPLSLSSPTPSLSDRTCSALFDFVEEKTQAIIRKT
jgi:hypothetical protein